MQICYRMFRPKIGPARRDPIRRSGERRKHPSAVAIYSVRGRRSGRGTLKNQKSFPPFAFNEYLCGYGSDQIDKGGNKLLCHNGEGDSSYFFVKEFVTKKTSDVQLRHNGSFLCGKIGLNGFENTWIVKKQRIWYRKKLY